MIKGISVIILAYKEEENLKLLLPEVKKQMEKLKENYQIIVVDVAQPLDDTEIVCKEYGCEYINQESPHFGGAFATGIRYAVMDKILSMDGDGAHNPVYIPAIYNMFMSGKYDVVIGSRYTKGGHTDDPILSVAMSHVLNYAYRLGTGIRAKDISTNFRMYYTEELTKIRIESQNYDVLQEILMKIQFNKQRKIQIGEVPIALGKRVYGESKRKLIVFIRDYIKTLIRLMGMRLKFSKIQNRG